MQKNILVKQNMKKIGLGDKVEQVIDSMLPKKYKNKHTCSACARRKALLNKVPIQFNNKT